MLIKLFVFSKNTAKKMCQQCRVNVCVIEAKYSFKKMKPVGTEPGSESWPTNLPLFAGENRLRYFQLLMNGSYTPRTLPVGGESPRSLAEALLVSTTFVVCIKLLRM